MFYVCCRSCVINVCTIEYVELFVYLYIYVFIGKEIAFESPCINNVIKNCVKHMYSC
jgi:hypothetical protein